MTSLASTSPLSRKRENCSGFVEVDECAIPLSKLLAVWISSDTKPNNGKIANLQKGLRLVYNGEETVGEGTGFGFPVLMYGEETYFSGSSHVYTSGRGNSKTVCKEFLMNKIMRKKIRNTRLENRILHTVWRWLTRLYQKHRSLRRLLVLTSISKKTGLHTGFYETASAGKVTVTYRINGAHIHVRAVFNHVGRDNLEKIFILNEQGSSFFRRYSDSNGTELLDKRIDAWEITEADHAAITDLRGEVGFQLTRIGSTILRVGREFIENYMNWVGLDYELSPRTNVFEYEIQVLGV